MSHLATSSESIKASLGRMEDADYAAETTNLAKSQILQQAATSMLAQANASKQTILSLLPKPTRHDPWRGKAERKRTRFFGSFFYYFDRLGLLITQMPTSG